MWTRLVSICAFLLFHLITASQPNYFPNYTIYHDLQRYQHTITSLKQHDLASHIATWYTPVLSAQGRNIERVTLQMKWQREYRYSTSSSSRSSPRILLLFGEHARELISTESALNLIHLIHQAWSSHACGEKYEHETQQQAEQREDDMHRIRYILQHAHIDIIPLLNPDGKARLESSGDWCWRNTGTGVDPNRNTAWEWCGPGASHDMKSEEYCGEKPWSEPESRYVRDIILNEGPWDAFFSIHSGEKQVFVPFVDTVSRRTRRRRATTSLELDVARRIVEGSASWFRNYGIAYDKNDYQADGTFMDWVAIEGKVPYSFIVEMWGGPMYENCFVQFNPPSDQLVTDLARIRPLYLIGLVSLLDDMLSSYGIKFEPLPRHDHEQMTRWRTLCDIERRLLNAKSNQPI